MPTSTTISEIAKALSAFQGELKPAKKDEVNPFFKMKYADLASIWGVVREPLAKNGLSVTQLPHTESEKLFLTTLLLHSSGEWISSEMPVIAQKADSQSIGSALTYARRYSLSSMLGVAAEDDDGESAGRIEVKIIPPVAKTLTPQELYELALTLKTGVALCNFALKNGWNKERIQTTLGIEKATDIKDVKAAAMVLFPKPAEQSSLIEEAKKLGVIEEGED